MTIPQPTANIVIISISHLNKAKRGVVAFQLARGNQLTNHSGVAEEIWTCNIPMKIAQYSDHWTTTPPTYYLMMICNSPFGLLDTEVNAMITYITDKNREIQVELFEG